MWLPRKSSGPSSMVSRYSEFEVLPRHGSMQAEKERSLLCRGRERNLYRFQRIAGGGGAGISEGPLCCCRHEVSGASVLYPHVLGLSDCAASEINVCLVILSSTVQHLDVSSVPFTHLLANRPPGQPPSSSYSFLFTESMPCSRRGLDRVKKVLGFKCVTRPAAHPASPRRLACPLVTQEP